MRRLVRKKHFDQLDSNSKANFLKIHLMQIKGECSMICQKGRHDWKSYDGFVCCTKCFTLKNNQESERLQKKIFAIRQEIVLLEDKYSTAAV